MRGRLNAAEFKSIFRKTLPCSFDEVFPYVQSKYRVPGLASIRRFQKGCH
jgi:hypothetical protein